MAAVEDSLSVVTEVQLPPFGEESIKVLWPHRLVMSLEESASAESTVPKVDAYIAPMAGMNGEAARLARELRRHDLAIELGDDSFKLKKSFESATRTGAKYILIVGENEVKADVFTLKNLSSGEQVSVPRGELAERIRS